MMKIGMHSFFIMPDLDGLSAYYKTLMKSGSRGGYQIPTRRPTPEYEEYLSAAELRMRPLP